MKTKNGKNGKNLALLLAGLCLAIPAALRADDLSWANPAAGGTWDAASVGNWYDDTTGAAAAAVPGSSDNVTINASGDIVITMPALYRPEGTKSLAVSSGVTLQFLGGANRWAIPDGVTNAGLLLFSGGERHITQTAGGGGDLKWVNTGTIALESGANTALGGSINNAGGLIDLREGGVLNTRWLTLISGGNLNIAAGAAFIHNDVVISSTLSNVAVANAGLFDWVSNIGGVSRNKTIDVTGGSFVNTGTVNLLQQGDGGAGTGQLRNLTLQFLGSNVFTNSGRILVSNTTPDSSSNNEYAQLTVNNGDGGSFTNESNGLIDISNAATGGNTVGSQYARLTVSSPGSFTNNGSITIRLDTAVTDDTNHFATLLIAGDWANAGVITVDGANKTLATASLDLSGKAYAQSVAAAITRLDNGGQLRAATVNITAGTLAGSGQVLATTLIGSGATLDPDGVLTLTNLTLSAGSLLEFTLGTDGDDLLQVNGDLALGGLLNITAGAGFGAAGQYVLANYTGTLTDNGLSVNNAPGGYNYELDYGTNGKVYLNLSIIPEPSTVLLLITGILLIGLLRVRPA